MGQRRKISFVIPVYNSASIISEVVERSIVTFQSLDLEVVLVDDGSKDGSADVCRNLVDCYPGIVVFAKLSRNFGEHNAVMAGLRVASGEYVAILDDDGQNPPEEVPRMHQALEEKRLDVIYGRYVGRKHAGWRRLGSAMNDQMANLVLGKPKEIYLSSFKVMNRFIVDEVIKYRGPYPYIDGLIWRTSDQIGQIDVQHDERIAGSSGYTPRRLIRLWLTMLLGFSILPLRISIVSGLVVAILSVVGLTAIIIEKLWLNPELPIGIPTMIATTSLFAGMQLVVLGAVGEYLGRLFLSNTGTPQSIVRSVYRGAEDE
ncbi:glycosyltransferase family 2 protein [Rubripirellula sp.]|nr:glycosyltransferase family 2 protein [Rubripirellula sp.]